MCKSIFFVVVPKKADNEEGIQQITKAFEAFEDLDSVTVTWTVVRSLPHLLSKLVFILMNSSTSAIFINFFTNFVLVLRKIDQDFVQ